MVRTLIPFGDRSSLSRTDDPFGTLRRELARMFDEAFGGFLGPSGDRLPGLLAPSVDVRETEGAIEVEAELPGVDEKDIQLTLENDVLTIKGEKKLEKQEMRQGYQVSERSYGSFYRSLPMPAGIDPNKANAVFTKGVLKITLPKPAEAQARARKIEVRPGESAGAGSSTATPGQGGGSVEGLAKKAWEGAKAGDDEGQERS